MSTRGKFLWYELMTTDVEAAKAFYGEVVGWRIQTWSDLGQPYPMLMAGEAGVGGIAELPEEARKMGAPPHWISYIGHPDVDEAVAQVQKLGGQVFAGPFDVPKIGRMAVMADPFGAVFSAYKPEGEGEMPEAQGPGKFVWNELMTADPDKAWDFYSALFGWTKHEVMDMGPQGPYQMYGRAGESSLGGFMKKPDEVPYSAWVHYVNVADLDRSVAETKKRGGQVMHGPVEIPGSERIAMCLDPQGAAFALHGK